MNFSVALERIPIAMGHTRTVLIIGLIGSWAGQIPGVFLLTHFWRKDLVGLFTGMVRQGFWDFLPSHIDSLSTARRGATCCC